MADHSYPLFIRELSVEDGGGYLVHVPDLKGCMADGETVEEAYAEGLNAIAEWIDEARRLGRDVPAPGDAARKIREQRQAIWKVIDQQDEVLRAKDELLQAKEAALKELRAELDELKEREGDMGSFVRGVTATMRTAHTDIVGVHGSSAIIDDCLLADKRFHAH